MRGAVWGRACARDAVYHRLDSVAFGPQTARCGAAVDVTSTHHCDPKSGPNARPCLGAICAACDALRKETP